MPLTLRLPCKYAAIFFSKNKSTITLFFTTFVGAKLINPPYYETLLLFIFTSFRIHSILFTKSYLSADKNCGIARDFCCTLRCRNCCRRRLSQQKRKHAYPCCFGTGYDVTAPKWHHLYSWDWRSVCVLHRAECRLFNGWSYATGPTFNIWLSGALRVWAG